MASLLRRTLARLRPKRDIPGQTPVGNSEKGAGDPRARERAAARIQAHAQSQATLFERAERLRARAVRLEREGTPSDSAGNRAERAEGEARASFSELRSSFVASGGDPEAFDLELGQHYPAFKVSADS
ncbi:MAG: hypothetical protein WA990_16125 [Rubrobacteraceae bacterium]